MDDVVVLREGDRERERERVREREKMSQIRELVVWCKDAT